jgi:hypothetical protein
MLIRTGKTVEYEFTGSSPEKRQQLILEGARMGKLRTGGGATYLEVGPNHRAFILKSDMDALIAKGLLTIESPK